MGRDLGWKAAAEGKIPSIPERRMTIRWWQWPLVILGIIPFCIVVLLMFGCEPACVPNLSEGADGGPAVLCK